MTTEKNATQQPVLLEKKDYVATITLNQPDKRNAMTPELLTGFSEKVRDVRDDTEMRVLIIRGVGRFFCTGASFGNSIPEMAVTTVPGVLGQSKSLRHLYAYFLDLLDVEIPVIAQINGHAIGGGLGLALACDFRIVSKQAKIGANFVRLGLSPGMATSYLLPRLIGIPRAAELLLTGRIINGEEAYNMGMMHSVSDENAVATCVDQLKQEILMAAPLAVRLAKKAMYQSMDFNPRDHLLFESFCQSASTQTKDMREGIMAAMEKREPEFKGK